MADTMESKCTGFLKLLVDKRTAVGWALILIAAALAIVTLLTATSWAPEFAGIAWIWGGGVTIAALGMGIGQLIGQADPANEYFSTRIRVLAAGGLAGLATTLAGILLAKHWWTDVMSWLSIEGDRLNGWGILLIIVALLAGLGAMLACLQFCRILERTNVVLRRMIYGYNMALAGLLILVNLAVVNCMVIGRTTESEDFTANKLYSLSDHSKSILKNLNEPVTIYLILHRGTGVGNMDLHREVANLVRNCQGHTDKITFKELAPDPNDPDVRAVFQEFSEANRGVLVVFGEGETRKARLIPVSDLYKVNRDPQNQTVDFTGEDALMTQLSFLTDDLKKPVIYFTQGHSEYDIVASSNADGAGVLKQRLEKHYYTVKPLKFAPELKRVPDDANVVVIAGPKLPFNDPEVDVLREYVKRPGKQKGKLFILLDVNITSGKKMAPTGLERFLAEQGVQINDQRVISIPSNLIRNPYVAPTIFNEQLSDNPLVKAFGPPYMFMLDNARPITVMPSRSPMSRTEAVPLMGVAGYAITESNLAMEPPRLAGLLLQNRPLLAKRLRDQKTPIWVGASVNEVVMDPSNPHPSMGSRNLKPFMFVVGDASFVDNRRMDEERRGPYFDLFTGILDYLRGRKDSIGIRPAVRDAYTVKADTNFFLLPATLIFLGIFCLGGGVWLVRRR